MNQTLEEFKLYQMSEIKRILTTKKRHLINPVTGWLDSRHIDKSKISGKKRRELNKIKKNE